MTLKSEFRIHIHGKAISITRENTTTNAKSMLVKKGDKKLFA